MSEAALQAIGWYSLGILIGIVAFLISYGLTKLKDNCLEKRIKKIESKTERNERGTRVTIDDKREIRRYDKK